MANKQTVFENNNKTKPVDDGWLNMVNEEYIKLCIGTGQTPDADTSQLVKGAVILASQAYLFCVDSGTTNNYVLNPVSPLQAPPSLRNGLSIKFTTSNANSGSTNINAYGFGNILAKNQDGTNLVAGDIPANTMVQFYYNGTNWILDKGAKATTTTQGISYLNNPITIANNATDVNNDIDFSAGNAPLDDGSGQVLLTSTLVKRLDASWVAGTNQGGLFSGTKAINTWYYLFAIVNTTTGATDAGFDSSSTGANIPAGYKGSYRGAVLTDGSGNIRAFKKIQNRFYLGSITDASASPSSSVYSTYTLSVPKLNNIIAMVKSTCDYTGSGVTTLGVNYRFTSTSIAIESYFTATSGYTGVSAIEQLPTNNLGQIDVSFIYTAPATNFRIVTNGYIDYNIKN